METNKSKSVKGLRNIEGRSRGIALMGENSQMSNMLGAERDVFKKCLDQLLNKKTQEEVDPGELDSILDAFKSNLQFCQQYEE